MLALDENHYFGGHYNRDSYTPEDTNAENVDMMDLVRRDRSHASVWMWNACNEVGCGNMSAAKGMRAAVDAYDTTRGMTENHLVDNVTLQYLTIQGMSHRAGAHMDSWHAQNPTKPLLSSEAVICPSERGVDSDVCQNPRFPPTPGQKCLYNNEVSNCTALQVGYSDSREFNLGTYVWSGFDYSDGTIMDGGALGMLGSVESSAPVEIPVATENLLENTDGVLHQCSLGAAACCLLFMLTRYQRESARGR